MDDDSYLRVDRLLLHLSKAPRDKLFMGALERWGSDAIRDPSNQVLMTDPLLKSKAFDGQRID